MKIRIRIETVNCKAAVDSRYMRGEVGRTFSGLMRWINVISSRLLLKSKEEGGSHDIDLPTYTFARLVDARFACLARKIAKFILQSLMSGHRYRLRNQRGRCFLARLDRNG